ncbi:MAG: GTPase HflX [Firmicutes bacterium]|nr:GTPase HflX [Bacillota bacterium]MBR6684626.1 GTPase HflX [Bacillota bacterium]
MYETKEEIQSFILVGVDVDRAAISAEDSLDELAELLATAGGEEAGRVIQKMEAINSRTYVGSGKVQEIKTLLAATGANGIICDDELTPAQLKNLSDLLDTKIIDRTLLILDIFSQRASTKEGKMQIELAQLEYRLTRLTGLGTELSRQGAAVGTHTRGAGETKLEMDRRHIRARMDMLRSQLKDVVKQRELIRTQRKKNQVPIVALVGYTNAGKSTLFNRLTSSGVLEEDKLFATLDTTTRKCELPSGRSVLFVDTVGFIHKLPHNLVKAFRATLEEAAYADILLHVVDASHENAELHMQVTYDELMDLEAADKPIMAVLNKQDLIKEPVPLSMPYGAEAVLRISALEPEGVQKVLEAVDLQLDKIDTVVEILLPYAQGGLSSSLHQEGQIIEEEYRDNGIYIKARLKDRYLQMVEKYRI